jgi:hypothetical protein
MRAETSVPVNEIIAIGTQDLPEKLSGPLLEREQSKRERLSLNEIVIKGLPA